MYLSPSGRTIQGGSGYGNGVKYVFLDKKDCILAVRVIFGDIFFKKGIPAKTLISKFNCFGIPY